MPIAPDSGTSHHQWLSVLKGIAPSSCFVQVMTASKFASTTENIFLDFRLVASNANFDVKRFPKPSKDDIETVETATRRQAANPSWRQSRIGRITASIFHEVNVKVKKLTKNKNVNFSDTLDKIFGNGPNLNHLPAIKYGIEMKVHAKTKYLEVLKTMHHKDIRVSECGLFLHSELCYIGATPDLLVECSCCGLGIVEMKCPHSISDKKPAVGTPTYLIKNSVGNISLNETHRYYTQVQGQMGVVNEMKHF